MLGSLQERRLGDGLHFRLHRAVSTIAGHFSWTFVIILMYKKKIRKESEASASIYCLALVNKCIEQSRSLRFLAPSLSWFEVME